MASRTKQKEEARARRLAEERARTARVRQQRRLRMVTGVVLGALAVVAVAIAVSSGGGGGGATGLETGTKLAQTQTTVNNLLSGIPQSGTTLGNPNAPVTMYYYGDLQCPTCRAFTLDGGFGQFVSNEVKAGKVKVQYRAFQTATKDPSTFQTQQVAALAAGKQNKFWNFSELFYRQQGEEGTSYVNDKYLTGIAQQIPGLDLATWRSARNDGTLAAQVSNDVSAGNSAGVNGTPTLIFQGPRKTATPSSVVPSYSDLQQALAQVQ